MFLIPLLIAALLLLLGSGSAEASRSALGFGADDYIEKPFSPGVLVARVKAHLAQYKRFKPRQSC